MNRIVMLWLAAQSGKALFELGELVHLLSPAPGCRSFGCGNLSPGRSPLLFVLPVEL